jgi:hypothetical protein
MIYMTVRYFEAMSDNSFLLKAKAEYLKLFKSNLTSVFKHI